MSHSVTASSDPIPVKYLYSSSVLFVLIRQFYLKDLEERKKKKSPLVKMRSQMKENDARLTGSLGSLLEVLRASYLFMMTNVDPAVNKCTLLQ